MRGAAFGQRGSMQQCNGVSTVHTQEMSKEIAGVCLCMSEGEAKACTGRRECFRTACGNESGGGVADRLAMTCWRSVFLPTCVVSVGRRAARGGANPLAALWQTGSRCRRSDDPQSPERVKFAENYAFGLVFCEIMRKFARICALTARQTAIN